VRAARGTCEQRGVRSTGTCEQRGVRASSAGDVRAARETCEQRGGRASSAGDVRAARGTCEQRGGRASSAGDVRAARGTCVGDVRAARGTCEQRGRRASSAGDVRAARETCEQRGGATVAQEGGKRARGAPVDCMLQESGRRTQAGGRHLGGGTRPPASPAYPPPTSHPHSQPLPFPPCNRVARLLQPVLHTCCTESCSSLLQAKEK
jgi:hypothetical protein